MARPIEETGEGDGSQGPASPIEQLLLECLEEIERGAPAADDVIERFCRRHPEHAAALRADLATLEKLGLLQPPAPADAAREQLPAERIGEFRLLRRLGEGGMGVVYLAEQTSLRRLVALKVLRAAPGASPAMATRFHREALTVARLRHPSIVALHTAGESGGFSYLAMEFVPGRGLDELLADAVREGRRVPVREVLRWGRDLARALHSAHEQGVVHRDVKPSNVRIRPDGRALLLDFGLARALEEPGLTRTGEFQGSPHYASPEQVSARGEIGAASDVYSLGATLYECVTGRPPFQADTAAQLFQQILTRDPPPPRRIDPTVPREVQIVLAKAMEKEAARRYASASALADDLEAILELRPIAARRPRPWVRLAKWARRNPGPAAGAATGAVALAILAAVPILQARAARKQALADAAQAVDDARAELRALRDSRASLIVAENEYAVLREDQRYRYLLPDEDRRFDELERTVERAARDRETIHVRMLALLDRAEEFDPGNPDVPRLRAEFYAEKLQEAENARDPLLAGVFRQIVLEIDPDGSLAPVVAAKGSVAFDSDPPGAEVFLFRVRELAELSEDGERRLLPVPVAGAMPVEAGTWCLRVVRGSGEVQPGAVIVSLDGRGVAELGALEAVGLAERGSIAALVFQGGATREIALPEGLDVRPTAAPLFPSPACRVGTTPTEPVEVEPGSYLALLSAPGFEDQRCSLVVGRGDSRRRRFALAPLLAAATDAPGAARSGPAGFVRVGPEAGGSEPGFWLQEHELTFAEYLEFINDAETLARIDERAALGARGAQVEDWLVPREPADPHCVRGADGRYALDPEPQLDWPVLGISWFDAQEYVIWRNARERARGSPFEFSLPTFEQWKLAGHAGDLRIFVHGNHFRPKWTSSNFSRPHADPEPVMSYPVDECVYGAFDMAGSVLEWLEDWYREGESRRAAGGAWGIAYDGSSFLVEGGMGMAPSRVSNMVGFRLAARVRP